MKKSLIFYYSWLELFEDLTDDEIGKVVRAAVEYDRDGKQPEFNDRTLKTVFRKLQQDIEDNRIKYEEKCAKNRENVNKRWKKHTTVYDGIEKDGDTNVYERIENDTNAYDSIRTDTNYTDNDNDNDVFADKEVSINKSNNIKPKRSPLGALFGKA